MANPQLENGFTRVANEILEQVMRRKFNSTQLRIILTIWRYTYGFNRKEHALSVRFLSQAIGAHRNHVDRELTSLMEAKVIIVVKTVARNSRVLMFNKNHGEWLIEMTPEQTFTPAPAEEKEQFADYVFLTRKEYDKLVADFGKETVDYYIESLDAWQTEQKPSMRKKDHNKTIRVWIRRDQEKRKQLQPKPQTQTPRQKKNQEQNELLKKFHQEGEAFATSGNRKALEGN